MGELFNQFVDEFKEIADTMDKYKTRVLYGYKWNHGGGTYVEYLLNNFYGIEFTYIVDDEELSYGRRIYRRNLFDYLDPDTSIIVNVDDKYDNLGGVLTQEGYQEFRVIDVCKEIGISNIGFFEWLESKFGVDIVDRSTNTIVSDYSEDNVIYSVSRGMSIPSLSKYIVEKYKVNKSESKMLDIGCGKGGAIICFKDAGVVDIDGVELLNELCKCAMNNLAILDMKSTIYNCNVLEFKKYAEYDYFYIYDAFRGETFGKVIQMIEDTLKYDYRNIVIAYANPWEHRRVVKNGVFHLVEQIEGDWSTRFVNIYEN